MKSLLDSAARQIACACLIFCSQTAFADENFIAGIYQDTTGNHYLVSGPTPTSTGRAQWTMSSTTPAVPGTTNNFNAIWETGAAEGNSLPLGSSLLGPVPIDPSGQSYGVITNSMIFDWVNHKSINCISCFDLVLVSFSQAGNTLTMSNGGLLGPARKFTYVSAGVNTTSASTIAFRPGVYKDADGNQYLVSGSTPSSAGRTQWTILSTTPAVPGTTNTLNATWETGAAVGNTFFIGDNYPVSNPLSFPITRSYGIISEINLNCCSVNWNSSRVISFSQAGNFLLMSVRVIDPTVRDRWTSQMLSYVSAGVNTTSVSTTAIQPGIYKDSGGNQYLVSGPTPSSAGRAQWTILSTTPAVPGTSNTFNAIWETGAAVGNIFLVGDSNLTSYPSGYPATRLYGITSDSIGSSFSWESGSVISLSQAGNVLIISKLNPNGFVSSSKMLSYVSAGVNTTSVSTSVIEPGIYKDPGGNQYLVSGPTPSSAGRAQWTLVKYKDSGLSLFYPVNAIWETGAAVGNTFLIGNSDPVSFPAGYPATRLYGITPGSSCYLCQGDAVVSISKVGNILLISTLNSNGSVREAYLLSYVSAGVNTTSVSTTAIQPGIFGGYTMLISGYALRPYSGTDLTFISQQILAVVPTGFTGGNNATTYPSGYPATRLYGQIVSFRGDNSIWKNARTISFSQVGSWLVISALNTDGSAASTAMLGGAVQIAPTAPTAPTAVSVTTGNGNAVISFTAPVNNGGSPITSYTATSSPGGFTGSCTAPCSSITINGLANGTAYTFTVTATNAAGTGAPSAALSSVTPTAQGIDHVPRVQRAFVASNGLDTNIAFNCDITHRCRTFYTAVAVVNADGEVVAVNSAAYGPVTLTRSISLTAAPGVYAGMSVFPGATGVTIATPGVNVVLRGLTINSQGGDSGVLMSAGSKLSIENCVISNFNGINKHGVFVNTAATVRVVDTIVRDNGVGIGVQGGATAAISKSKFLGNDSGILVQSAAGMTTSAAVSNSVVAGGGTGIEAFSGTSGNSRINIVRSSVTNNTVEGIVASATAGTASVTLNKSMVSGNAIGFYKGTGGTLNSLGNNTITNNGSNTGTLTLITPK